MHFQRRDQEILKLVYDQWLFSNLRESTKPNFEGVNGNEFSGRAVFQVRDKTVKKGLYVRNSIFRTVFAPSGGLNCFFKAFSSPDMILKRSSGPNVDFKTFSKAILKRFWT